jgi:hypothetical protein
MSAVMKKPARVAPPCAGAFDASGYTKWVKTYDSRQKCLDELGGIYFCQSHAARSVKKSGNVTFLKCRLRFSDPACLWSAVVRADVDGTAALYQHPNNWTSHNQQSPSMGTRGFGDMSQRKALSDLLVASATAKPSVALRTARLKEEAGTTQLKSVQSLKKGLVSKLFGCKTLGTLRETLAKHSGMPANKIKGFFSYSFVSPPGEKKPMVTVVATTRALQERWTSAASCPAAVDGGFKFNLLGWPLHVLGAVNPAGEFGLCGLAMTSSMQKDHVKSMFEGHRDSTARTTRENTALTRSFGMADGEEAYRSAFRQVFKATNLMCFFHVKQAAKDNMWKHLPGNQATKEKTWDSVAADIDLIHGAMCLSDFKSRCEAVRSKWASEQLPEATTWSDKQGRSYNFVDSFFLQWEVNAPEWYLGASATALTTNNACEACIKNTRNDAGNVVGSIGEVLVFLLKQVEHVSSNVFDPTKVRKIPSALWQRALLFKTLFYTDHVRRTSYQDQIYYCCQPRTDPESMDVCLRKTISVNHASDMAKAFAAQVTGQDTTVGHLVKFTGPSGVRVFGFKGEVSFCTCPAFCSPGRQCFHTLGLAVWLGKCEPPETEDNTLLSVAARPGNKRKAPPRGSVPLMTDQKDLRIAQLEAALRKVKRHKGEPETAATCIAVATRTRRLTKKTPAPAPPAAVPLAPVIASTSVVPLALAVSPSADSPLCAPSDTKVWRALEDAFNIPPDVLTSLFTGLAQWYGEEGALRLLEEDWLRDLTDRWIPLAAVCQEKRPDDDTSPVLPCVLQDFKTLLFAVLRCAVANSKVAVNLRGTDEEHLATLQSSGFKLIKSSGHNNNCLIHSLATTLASLGFIAFPPAREEACERVRQHLIQTPGLHPRTPSGQKSKSAYLEHGVHAQAIVRRLHHELGNRPLPEDGIRVTVHARYAVAGQSPADSIVVAASTDKLDAGVTDVLHLFNWTGLGCSGFHYDALQL